MKISDAEKDLTRRLPHMRKRIVELRGPTYVIPICEPLWVQALTIQGADPYRLGFRPLPFRVQTLTIRGKNPYHLGCKLLLLRVQTLTIWGTNPYLGFASSPLSLLKHFK